MSLARLSSHAIATVRADCLVSEAARLMTMLSVGALVIAESRDARPQGIFTDRDLVRLIGEGADPKSTTVACFADSPPVTAPLDASTDELLAHMRKAGVRRIPLVDSEDRLVKVVSLDDLLVQLGRELGQVADTIEREFRQENPEPSGHQRSG